MFTGLRRAYGGASSMATEYFAFVACCAGSAADNHIP
jgi:hypothetical protein